MVVTLSRCGIDGECSESIARNDAVLDGLSGIHLGGAYIAQDGSSRLVFRDVEMIGWSVEGRRGVVTDLLVGHEVAAADDLIAGAAGCLPSDSQMIAATDVMMQGGDVVELASFQQDGFGLLGSGGLPLQSFHEAGNHSDLGGA